MSTSTLIVNDGLTHPTFHPRQVLYLNLLYFLLFIMFGTVIILPFSQTPTYNGKQFNIYEHKLQRK